MTVKVVTDSTSDLPKELAQQLGITVVPLNVHFGTDTFRDGEGITADQFYERLLTSPALPKTSAPSPGLFRECYGRLSHESNEIVSIHISSKLSGTYEAALTGGRDLGDHCRVEVIDSQTVTMGLGLLAVAAAKAARQSASLDEVVKLVRDSMPGVYMASAVDSLEYLQKGGRIGRAQAWLGSLLSIKPIISVSGGEVVPLERVRTYSKAVVRVYEILEAHLPARELSVMYSTDAAEADKLMTHVRQAFPQQPAYLARFGPVLGTYMGPGCLAIAALS